jgi:hypothetical protein
VTIGKADNESRGRTLLPFREFQEEEWTDDIIRGDFTKFRGPLDLARCKIVMAKKSKDSKLRRDRTLVQVG